MLVEKIVTELHYKDVYTFDYPKQLADKETFNDDYAEKGLKVFWELQIKKHGGRLKLLVVPTKVTGTMTLEWIDNTKDDNLSEELYQIEDLGYNLITWLDRYEEEVGLIDIINIGIHHDKKEIIIHFNY